MKSIFLVLFVLIIINVVNGLCPHEIANLVRWSQWNKAPSSSGATVNIDASSAILLDVSPPVIEHIDVYGTLVFDPNVPTIDLTVGSVYVRNGGKMYLGTSECPMNKTIVNINLKGSPRVGVDPEGLGTKVLGVQNGGLLEIHGKPRKVTWTVLQSSASINSSQITLAEDVDWAIGETIIIATTDFEVFNDEKGYPLSQNEQVIITSRPSSNSVTFSPPIKYMHYGKIWTGQNGDFVDMRGEVALISRNILIKGDLSTELSGDSEAKQWGGHVMIRDGGVARIEHIEVTKLGQRGEFGRYPLHFHNSSSAPNSYLRGNSIHDTFQRCIVVHSTHDLRIQNNVAYRGKGHCYFVEDGNEERNVFDHNIGIKPVVGDLLTSDSEPAVFWITNPNNHYYKNVAVGGKFGYWYSMPESPLALSAAQVTNKLRSRLSGDFIGNKAHSSNIGLFVDRGQENAKPGTNNRLTDYNPTNMTAALLLAAELGVPVDVTKLSAYDLSVAGFRAPAYFVDFTAYKSMEEGMWGRGSYMFSYGAKLADNQVGAIWPGYANMMQKTIMVGETDNIGTFNTVANKWWGDEEGRSRATKYFIHNPVLGYSSYDASGGDIVMDINFYNFNDYTFTVGDNAGKIRKTGALTGLTGPNVIEPINRIYRAKFFNVQRRVYYREFYPWEQNLAETDDAVKGIVWVDADGSILAGLPEAGCGKTIVGSGAIVRNANCVQKADWNAYICNANTNAHRAVYVVQNAKPTSYLSPEEIRLAFDLNFNRLNDNAKLNVAPDLGQYSDTLMAADFRYGTNLIVNNNYYVSLGNKNTFLSNFNIRMNNMEVGEKIRFAFPFSGTSTPTVKAGYSADQPTKEVSSYSQLVSNSYFQDKSANLLWIHLEVDAMDYSFYQNLPFATSYVGIQVTSDCVKNSDNLCSYPERAAAPANPGNLPQVAANLCETSGAVTNGIKTFTKKDNSEYVLFGDSLPSSFDNKTNENCVVSNNLVYDGSSSLRCKYQKYAYGGYNRAWAANPPSLSLSPFTHVQVSVRVAPGHGDIKLSMSLFNRSWTHFPWVPLHSPFYTEDAGPITEKKWTVCTIPIGDFEFPAGQSLWGFGISVNLPRPVEFYLDNIKFVSLTPSLSPISNYPVAPPAPSRVGPGPSTEYGTDPPVVDTSGSTTYDPNIKDSASSLSFSLFIVVGVLLSIL